MNSDPNGDEGRLVSIDREHEQQQWARDLGCTVDELQEAVEAVGRSVTDIRLYLVSRRGGTG
jgi:Mlc titration factor MtfA (ptsG expression regulator)